MVVAEEVVVSARSQCDVPSKTLYGSLTATAPAWMTETSEVKPGIHMARVVIRNDVNVTKVRVVNVGDQPATLSKDSVLGGLHPVQVIPEKSAENKSRAEEAELVIEELMKDVPKGVPLDAKENLESLLRSNLDVFSLSDKDLGRTTVCEHKIDTGNARPVRQPLRRQPLSHQAQVDAQLDQMLEVGPIMSEEAVNVVSSGTNFGVLLVYLDDVTMCRKPVNNGWKRSVND